MEGPGKGGKRKPIVRGGFDTAKEAQQALDEARVKLKHGIVVNDRLTVGRYLDEWLAAKGDIRPSTLRGYQQHIKKYLRPGLGHLRLAEVRLVHVAECLAEVTSSDANRQRVRATLRAAFNDAIREGLILINPAAFVKLPSGARPKGLVWTPARVQRWEEALERLAATDADDPARALLETAAQPPSAVMVWTPAQLGSFLDAAEDDPLYALFHLIAHRGLRRGESCGLAWADVDLDAARMTVRQQIVQLGWDTYEDTPKSDAGDREVPWTPARSPRFARTGVGRSRPSCSGDRRGSTRARCSPARTAQPCIRQRSPTGSRHSPPRRRCRRSGCTISGTAPRHSCWLPGWPRRLSRRPSGTRRSRSPSTRTRASTAKSPPKRRRLRRHSFRVRAPLHTHRIHTPHRGPREDQQIPGQTVGRVGLEPTT